MKIYLLCCFLRRSKTEFRLHQRVEHFRQQSFQLVAALRVLVEDLFDRQLLLSVDQFFVSDVAGLGGLGVRVVEAGNAVHGAQTSVRVVLLRVEDTGLWGVLPDSALARWGFVFRRASSHAGG